MRNFANTLSQLMKYHSWKLERISPTTYPNDIVIKLKGISEAELDAARELVKGGTCYRCRIAQRRFFFGASPTAAIEAALNDVRPKKTKAAR